MWNLIWRYPDQLESWLESECHVDLDNPDPIVFSSGLNSKLWFNASNQIQILSDLPQLINFPGFANCELYNDIELDWGNGLDKSN